MNININSNYQSSVFGGAKLPQRNKLGRIVGALALAAPIAHEINSDRFVKQNSQGPRSYTEQLTDMINSKPILKNNKNIQENFDSIVMNDNPIPKVEDGGMSLDFYVQEKTQARLEILDIYSLDKSLQNNEYIRDSIGDFVCLVKKYNQADRLKHILLQNADCNNKGFFENLKDMLRYNINPDLMYKVQSNEDLYNILKPQILYNIGGYDESKAANMKEILDVYLKKYTKSENVTNNLSDIIKESLEQKQEEPLSYASKKMQEDADK